MAQFKIFLNRLKKPSVILSLISQIIIILSLLNINVDTNQINAVATGIMSILVTMGIMSNPDTKNKTFGDDIRLCENCGNTDIHVDISGELTCTVCGFQPEL